MQTFATGWLLAGAACILGLAAYAALLWRRVWLAKQQREQQLSVQKKQRHEDLLVFSQWLSKWTNALGRRLYSYQSHLRSLRC